MDYHKNLHPKTHIMDDWSTVMLSNISTDVRFLGSRQEYTPLVSPKVIECQDMTFKLVYLTHITDNQHHMESQVHLDGLAVELHDTDQEKSPPTCEGEEGGVVRV